MMFGGGGGPVIFCLSLRDHTVINYGKGGYKNGQIEGPKHFCLPLPQNTVQLFAGNILPQSKGPYSH